MAVVAPSDLVAHLLSMRGRNRHRLGTMPIGPTTAPLPGLGANAPPVTPLQPGPGAVDAMHAPLAHPAGAGLGPGQILNVGAFSHQPRFVGMSGGQAPVMPHPPGQVVMPTDPRAIAAGVPGFRFVPPPALGRFRNMVGLGGPARAYPLS